MSRGTWNKIKRSKYFYVQTYRLAITLVIASQAFNIILYTAIIYSYFHKPIETFYATSGETLPIELSAMKTPNYSSEALLAPDPVNVNETKPIPE